MVQWWHFFLFLFFSPSFFLHQSSSSLIRQTALHIWLHSATRDRFFPFFLWLIKEGFLIASLFFAVLGSFKTWDWSDACHYFSNTSGTWFIWFHSVKGQIISKGLLVSSNSPKKQMKKFILLLRQICLFVLWENSRTPKSPFEIIWPLGHILSFNNFLTNWPSLGQFDLWVLCAAWIVPWDCSLICDVFFQTDNDARSFHGWITATT